MSAQDWYRPASLAILAKFTNAANPTFGGMGSMLGQAGLNLEYTLAADIPARIQADMKASSETS